MTSELSTYIGALAIRSIMYEVSASPKPGLIDRFNNGAHKDMDYFTFIDSASMIGDDFRQMALAGEQFTGCDLWELFNEIRQIGIATERKMFQITGGINTHKGIIFSIGIISAAAAFLMTQKNTRVISAEEICGIVPDMVGSLCQEFDGISHKEDLTHGERLYLKYGVKGIRGEVESGFKTVLSYGMPQLRSNLGKQERNAVLVNTLLSLMTGAEDSNILHRHSMDVLNHVQIDAGIALSYGGLFTTGGCEFIESMNQDFTNRDISPGGSADLLAVTIFLGMLEGLEFVHHNYNKCTKKMRDLVNYK